MSLPNPYKDDKALLMSNFRKFIYKIPNFNALDYPSRIEYKRVYNASLKDRDNALFIIRQVETRKNITAMSLLHYCKTYNNGISINHCLNVEYLEKKNYSIEYRNALVDYLSRYMYHIYFCEDINNLMYVFNKTVIKRIFPYLIKD